jgi:ZIP family zinc transporter
MTTSLALGVFVVFAATTAGAVPALFARRIGDRVGTALSGATAGIMLGATFFSLLLPAYDLERASGTSALAGSTIVGFFLLAGALALHLFDRFLPHEHLIKGPEGMPAKHMARTWLVIIAMALHNFPEGLAVGVGLGSGDSRLATTLLLAVAFQDFPEGWVVGAGLAALGFRRRTVLGVTAFTGLVESLGVIVGYGAIQISQALLPGALAFCAGAMLFVVSHEVIPETHRHGHERAATFGLLLGFVATMILDRGLSG